MSNPRASSAQREHDPAAGEDLQVAALGRPPRRETEDEAGHRGTPAAHPELARQQVGGRRAERPREQEHDVVADQRRRLPVPDQPEGEVAEQAVGERQRVVERVENVCVEDVSGIGDDVTVPRELPGLQQRVAEVLRNGGGGVHHRVQVTQAGEPEGDHERQGGLEAGPAGRGAGQVARKPAQQGDDTGHGEHRAPPTRLRWRRRRIGSAGRAAQTPTSSRWSTPSPGSSLQSSGSL